MRRLRLLMLTVALLGAAPAAAAAPAVYKGGSRAADRHMDIELQVLGSGRRANWRIDVYAPCTLRERLGRTVGTDAGGTPPDPELRIVAGRFTLKRRATNPNDGLAFAYTLTGHAVAGGFAGTFHYAEHQGAYRCDSHVLRWRARRTSSSFP